MEVGIVTSFGSNKNGQPISYGWIKRQGSLAEYLQRKRTSSSSDIFVHRSKLLCSVDALQEGVFVLFEVEFDPKKDKEEACNVKLLKEIGIVKWFGNYNSKTNKENDFGFIEQLRYHRKDNIYREKDDILLHQSQINGLADRLKEGVIVTFSIRRKNFITKRDEALDVKLLHEEDEIIEHYLPIADDRIWKSEAVWKYLGNLPEQKAVGCGSFRKTKNESDNHWE